MIEQTKWNELQQYLSELTDCAAFEILPLVTESERQNYYIPYMMNDALEYYIVLKDCRLTGIILPGLAEVTTAELIEDQHMPALIVRQGQDNLFTVWFQNVEIHKQCYQYHRIGHFWVSGREPWRRLVYMIGTAYDKRVYIGDEVCNAKERTLLPLMEFAPFRTWFPFREIPAGRCDDTPEGIECMRSLASEAGDHAYLRLLKLYERFPYRWIGWLLGQALARTGRIALYNLIFRKITEASLEYPERDYGSEQNQLIQNQRARVTAALHSKGFTGEYPAFQRGNLQILAAEEHPFTILDEESYQFRIQFMVSESTHNHAGINAGFFGSGKNSRITQDLSFLD